jgi:uncharacterized protein
VASYIVLFIAAAVAGAVNAVAGGGTLLTFPALLWAGQPAIFANATSTVALWPGALSSFWGYRPELTSTRREIVLLLVPSLLGGVLGALLLVHTDPAAFALIVPYLILMATGLFIVQEPLARWQRRVLPSPIAGEGSGVRGPLDSPPSTLHSCPPTPVRWAAVLAFQFLVGVYGGYFGAGIGILMLAAFGFLGFANIHQANAIKNLNAMVINGIAAALFIAKGLVDWRLALVMAVSSVVGGYAGAGTARRIGQKNVRRLVILIGFCLAAWMLWWGR